MTELLKTLMTCFVADTIINHYFFDSFFFQKSSFIYWIISKTQLTQNICVIKKVLIDLNAIKIILKNKNFSIYK